MEGVQKGILDQRAGKKMKRLARVCRGTEEEEWGAADMTRGLCESKVVCVGYKITLPWPQ